MTKAFTFILAFLVSASSLAQNRSTSITLGNKYDHAALENFKKLGIDWSLPPAELESMNTGLNLLTAGEWKAALNSFDKVAEADTAFVPVYYFRYLCFYVAKNLYSAKADKNYDQFRRKLPVATKAMYADLWDIYVPERRDLRQNASLLEIAPPLSYLSAYLVQQPTSASQTELTKAFSFLFAAKPELALNRANELLKTDQSVGVRYLKAVTFQILSQHDSSFRLYSEIIKEDKDLIEAHESLAIYKQRLGDFAGVAKHLLALSRLAPRSRNVWRFNGMMKVQIQDYYGAILELTKCLKTDSTDFDCLKQRAIALQGVKNYLDASRDLNAALRLKNTDLELYFLKSENYLNMGDSVRTIKILTEAKQLLKYDDNLDLFLANKLCQVNKLARAQVVVDYLFARIKLNGYWKYEHQTNLIQCDIYVRKGLDDKALKILNTQLAKDGDQTDYLFLRAKLYLRKGDAASAKLDLDKLVKAGFTPAIELSKTL